MIRRFFKDAGGTVLLEAVVTLPVFLLALMAAGQFAHIWYARQMVAYAAWSGARAAVVQVGSAAAETAALSAAKDVCSVITLMAEKGSANTDLELPWLGTIAGSRDVTEKMSVSVTDSEAQYCQVAVTMQFPLLFPFVNNVISGVIKYTYEDDSGAFGKFGIKGGTASGIFSKGTNDVFPLITLSETAVVARTVKLVN